MHLVPNSVYIMYEMNKAELSIFYPFISYLLFMMWHNEMVLTHVKNTYRHLMLQRRVIIPSVTRLSPLNVTWDVNQILMRRQSKILDITPLSFYIA